MLKHLIHVRRSRPPIVSNVTLEFDTTSRVALVGANGEGKSTLMATIVGAILPLKGKVTVHPRLRVAYFSQHHAAVCAVAVLPCYCKFTPLGLEQREA